jgi:hypothetical protein
MEHATLEPSRKDRIRRTCAKKFTKLQDWSRRGARTILILEDNDIVSTNELLVFDALEAVRHEFEFWPDEIYMVGTFLDEYWPIWLLWMASTATIPWTISEKAGLFATRKS